MRRGIKSAFSDRLANRVGRLGLLAVLIPTVLACMAPAASAAGPVPGWECVPTTAGQTVTSGGTGPTPSCSSGTAVLAPTYVALGVDKKPTVQFSAVNVQVVSGSGSTSGPVNGVGNLIVGYEPAITRSQGGSNDLIVGTNDSGPGSESLSPGADDTVSGDYGSGLGDGSVVNGLASTVTGGLDNTSSGAESSVAGGQFNTASGGASFVSGGCDNLAGPGSTPSSTCTSTGGEAVDGGLADVATGLRSWAAGGNNNVASGWQKPRCSAATATT